ncbi:MAG: Zn-dependent hydrolase [Terriglobales bacterium]
MPNAAVAIIFITLVLIMSPLTHAQGPRQGSPKPAAPNLKIAPDIAQRVAKFKSVDMPFDAAGLTAREKSLVEKLVEASHYFEYIFWRQLDPEALFLYQQLASANRPQSANARRYIFINASRFDLLEDNQPFVCTQEEAAAHGGHCPPMYPGRGFFPQGLTRDQVERYVAQHPDKKSAIYDSQTVVRRKGNDLETVPYHVAYRSFLEPAAKALREAAALSDDPAFANFLRLRADALLSDDYYPSDLAWLDLKSPKFDVIFAPYETYDDGLLGVKTSYDAAVLIRNQAESAKLTLYQKYIPDIQDALPLPPEDRPSKRGHETPMEVMDTPFRAGDLNHGYQAVAENLPNDPRIHQEKGTKKIFFKNFMDARVNFVILPVAKKLMRPDQAAHVSAEGYMAGTLLHEIAHGLGPAFARKNGKQVDIREAIGPVFSGLEEAKADAVGMFGLEWLADHGVVPKDRMPENYASYVGGLLRTMRFGAAEAHGTAETMEFNYLSEQNAVRRDPATGRYWVDYAKAATAIAALAKELLEIEATGDRARAERWFRKYNAMPAELKAALATVADVPVDITPNFSFPQQVE